MSFTSSVLSLIRTFQVGVPLIILFFTLPAIPSAFSAQSSHARPSGVHSAVPVSSGSPAISAAPPVGGTNVVVTSAGNAQNETSIAINLSNPSNLIGGANDYRGGDSACGRYVSTNNGRTWTDGGTFPLFTDAGYGSAYTAAGDTGTAFDANGHAYFLCMYFTRTPGGDATQYVHKSLDGGATWGPPIKVSSATAGSHFDDKGHMAVDNKSLTANRGNVYVAWGRLDQNELRFARSTNGGVSFDADIKVNDGGNAVTGANIAVGIDGAVYVAWIDETTNQITIDKSTNGGVGFGALSGGTDHTIRSMTRTDAVRPLSRVNSFPVISTDSFNANILYAVWAEKPAGTDDSEIMFSRSVDGGNTWSAPIRVNDDINPPGDFNSQFFPWMATDPVDGSINVVWYDNRLDPSHTDDTPLVDLFFASSNDAGLSFSLNTRISTQSSDTTADFGATGSPAAGKFFGDYNAIAAYGGVAYPLWTDSRSDGQNLMTTQVGGADLAITKVAPAQVNAGSTLTYTITVTNNGPAVAFNVIVTDTLPAGATFAGSTVLCTGGSTRSCSVGNLAPGDSTTFTINVTVDPAASSGTTLTNTASVAADQQDPNLSDNTASASTIVTVLADLRVDKVCKPDGPAAAGSTAFCNITVTNNGPSAAQSVVLTDHIVGSGQFQVSSVSPSSGCSPTSTGNVSDVTIVCNLGTVGAGTSLTKTVNFTSSGANDVNDTATVGSATPDPNSSNNSATGHVSFTATADLAVTKGSTPNPVTAGTNLVYTINVTNNGPSLAPNVVVKDTLPAQVSDVTFTPSVGSCIGGIPGNPALPLTCNLGNLSNGASASIIVTAKVIASTPDGTIIVNNAVVSSDVADPNTGNNNATALTTVQTRADLSIVKTSDQATYKPSSRVTYSITVNNNGPSDAQAVVVTDNLPDVKQALYQSDTGGCQRNSATNPTQLRCVLGDMKVGESRTFFVVLLVRGNKGNVSNTASVSSSTTDPSTGNNSSTRVVTIGK